MPALDLRILDDELAICRLDPDEEIPAWVAGGGLWCITRTEEELSLVCATDQAPEDARSEGPWRALKVQGPLDFALTGILAALAAPLAEAGIPIFALSTFDTDYLLVRSECLDLAVEALRAAGHRIP